MGITTKFEKNNNIPLENTPEINFLISINRISCSKFQNKIQNLIHNGDKTNILTNIDEFFIQIFVLFIYITYVYIYIYVTACITANMHCVYMYVHIHICIHMHSSYRMKY